MLNQIAGFLFILGSILFPFKSQSQTVGGYIEWSKLIGGSGNDKPINILTDGTYLYYVINTTSNSMFRTSTLANQPAAGGSDDNLYVVKLRQDGSIVWARYLGGSGSDYAGSTRAIKLVGSELYIAGVTNSTDFPTAGGVASSNSGLLDYFITRLDANGNIVMSRYIGGAANEQSAAFPTAVGRLFPILQVENGIVYLMGQSLSNNYPVTVSGVGSTRPSTGTSYQNASAVITRLNANNGAITYSKYFGGSAHAMMGNMAVENGSIYAMIRAGGVNGENTIGSTDGSTMNGTSDWAFQKINAAGTTVYSKYIGGNTLDLVSFEGYDALNVMAYNGDLYAVATQAMPDFQTTDGSFALNASGPGGATNSVMALKLNANGSLGWSKLLSATNQLSTPTAELVNGQIIISASLSGTSPVITNGSIVTGGSDAALIKLNLDGTIAYGGVIGGSGNEPVANMPPIEQGGYYFGKLNTLSTDFPVTNGSTASGSRDDVVYLLNSTGNILFASYIGGAGTDYPLSSFANFQNQVVIGNNIYSFQEIPSASSNYPVTSGNYNGGTYDASITKFSLCPNNYYTKNDTIRPLVQTTCINGISNMLIGNAVVIPSDSLPKIYRNGTLQDQPPIDNLSYQWQVSNNFNGPFTDIAGATLKNYLPTVGSVTQYYRRIARQHEFCGGEIIHISDTASVIVNSLQTPVAPTVSPYQTCAGSPVTIGAPATGGTGPYTYSWDMGITVTTATVNFTPTTTSVVTQTIVDANGCKQLVQYLVNAYQANAGLDASVCANTPVLLGEPSNGVTGVSYVWSPATNLSSTTIAQPIATPTAVTTYTLTATLTKTNTGGGSATCSTTDQVIVTPVTAPTNASFAGPDRTMCFGSSVTLGATEQFVNIGHPSASNPQQFAAVSQSTVNTLTGTTANLSDNTSTNGARTINVPNATPFVSVSQSSAGTTGTVANLNDGVYTTGAATTTSTVGQWITVDLGSNILVGGLRLATISGTGASYTYQISTDNINWSTISFENTVTLSNSALSTNGVNIFVTAYFGRYIRVINNADATGVNLSEIRVLQAQWVQVNFGQLVTNITSVSASAVTANALANTAIWYSEDGNTWTKAGVGTTQFTNSAAGVLQALTLKPAYSIPAARFLRLVKANNTTLPLDVTAIQVRQELKYTWTPGSNLSANNIAQPIYDPGNLTFPPNPDPVTYTVTAERNGCVFTDQVVVSTIRANAGGDRCGPRTLGENTDAPNLNETFSWTIVSGTGRFLPGNTTTSNVPYPSVTATASGTTVYRLTTTLNGVTCTDDVNVPSCGCLVSIQVNAPFGCPSLNLGPVTLIADAGNDEEYTYSWSPTVGLSTYTGSTVQLTDNIARTYTVTKTSRLDPTFTCSGTVLVNQPNMTEPNFNPVSANVCPGSSIEIGQPTVSGYSYAWIGSNLSSNTISNPTYNVPATAGGLQLIPVVVTDVATGCISRDTAKIDVFPTIANAGPDWATCSAGIIQLGTPALPNYTYSWSPASTWLNGTSATSAQPQVTVASNRSYFLEATNTLTGCVSRDTAVITVSANPVIPDAPNVTICKGAGTIIGSPAQAGYTYSWSPTAGLSNPNIAQPFANPTATTNYVLTVSYNIPGCITTTTDNVVATFSNPEFTMPPISYCPSNGAVTLSGAPAGMTSYSWSPSNLVSNPSIQTPTTLTPAPSATTGFDLTVTNSDGCQATSTLVINPTQTAPIAGSTRVVCMNSGPISLGSSLNETSGFTYQWSPSAGLSNPTSINPTFTPTAAGTYTFVLTKTNTLNGCISTDDVTIIVNDYQLPNFNATNICNGTSVQIGTTPAEGATYFWTPSTGLSSTTTSSTITSVTSSTIYTLVSRGINGCVDTAFVPVIVSTTPAPVITLNDQSICVGTASTTTLNPSVSPTGTYTYKWTPNNGLLSSTTVLNPTITLANFGVSEYTLLVTSSDGCTAQKTASINYDICPPVMISGNVFNDLNSNTTIETGEGSINVGVPLTMYLVDGSGLIIGSDRIGPDGSYSFEVSPNATYTLMLSSTNYSIGTSPLIDTSLPIGFSNTGENGSGNNTGLGDGTANGILTVEVATQDKVNQNFGIVANNQCPFITNGDFSAGSTGWTLGTGWSIVSGAAQFGSDNVTNRILSQSLYTIPNDTLTLKLTLGALNFGSAVSTLQIRVGGITYATITNPAASAVLTAAASNGATINGFSLTAGTGVYNTDDFSISIPYTGSPLTNLEFSFTGGSDDFRVDNVVLAARCPISITGTVFNDVNSNVLLDGTESGTTAGTTFYVYLVEDGVIVDSSVVASNGTYELLGDINSNYTIYLSQVKYAIGTSPSISTVLPTGWNRTGENGNGLVGGDGTPDGILQVTVLNSNVINQDFGIRELTGCQLVSNGDFASGATIWTGWENTNWTVTSGRAQNITNGITNQELNQSLTGVVSDTLLLYMTLGAQNSTTASHSATLEVLLDGVKYAEFINPSNSTVVAGNAFNGAMIEGLSLNTVSTGWTTNNLLITIPNYSGSTNPVLTYRMTSTGDDFFIDDVSLYGDCFTPCEAFTNGKVDSLSLGWNRGPNWDIIGIANNNPFFYNNSNIPSPGSSVSQMLHNVQQGTLELSMSIGGNNCASGPGYAAQLAIRLNGVTYVTFTNPSNSTVPTVITSATSNGASLSNFSLSVGNGINNFVWAHDVVLTIPNYTGPSNPLFEVVFIAPNTGNPPCGDDFAVDNFSLINCPISISGSVFNDVNGNTIIEGGETFTTLPEPLYVYLVDNNGIVVDSAHVAPDGTYTLNASPSQTYTLILSTVSYPIGTDTLVTPINTTPPSGWVTVGENGNNNTGPGDLNPNGKLTVIVGLIDVNNQNFAMTRAGYIYIQKKALDETSSINFPFTVSGGATLVPGFSLNDKDDQIAIRDIGSSQNGRLWAVGVNNILYYRDVNTSVWVATNVTNAFRVDGGPGNSCYYITITSDPYSYIGGISTLLGNWPSFGGSPASDIGNAWNNKPYIVNNAGQLWQYSGTGTTWIRVGTSTDNFRVDGNPSNGDAIVAKTNNTIWSITSAGVETSLGNPAGTSALSEVAVTSDGGVFGAFAVPSLSSNNYAFKWISGTTWSSAELTSRNYVFASMTGGLGGQVWSAFTGTTASSVNNNIFTRTFDGTNTLWLNDERVRTTVTGNSAMIAVVPGTYTVTELVPAGWDLQGVKVYDPTNNSVTSLVGNTATLVVEAGETVVAVFENGLLNPFTMTNDCDVVYQENFGTGPAGSYGLPLVGQTSYHYQTTGNTLANNYKIVGNANMLFSGAANLSDHTSGDGQGYMFAVDANNEKDAFFRRRFIGIIPGVTYNFSAWIANINAIASIKPNVTFEVIDPITYAVLDSVSTGDITSNAIWTKYGLTFTATTTTFDLVIRNNGSGGTGNDLAIDDISFELLPATTPITTVSQPGCGTLSTITVTSPIGASYEYSLDGFATSAQSSPVFTNLTPGIYSVSARFIGTTNCIASKLDTIKVAICGSVFNDANGNTIINAGESGTTAGTNLYVYLVDSNGIVVDSSKVLPDGTYTLGANQNQNYTIELSQVQYPIGLNTNTYPLVTAPPAGYVNTGENGNNNTGPGDGTPDGKLAVIVGTTDVTQQNFGLVDECNPLASGLVDTDGDGISDVCDLDDDNDGITDTAENECLNTLVANYPANFYLIKPSDFGINYNGTPQTGFTSLTADLSDKFGYPANSGAVIVNVKNANVHPDADEFYNRGDLGVTDWEITGSLSTILTAEHGLEYFPFQRREVRLYNYDAQIVNQATLLPGNWVTGVEGNTYYQYNNSNTEYSFETGMQEAAVVFTASTEMQDKKFGTYTNDIGLDRWSTYFVRIAAECDFDKDGIPNRLDKDSDNDGCVDAVEGGGSFDYDDINGQNQLTGSVNASGIPTVAGTGQSVGTSQDSTTFDPACFVSIIGTVFNDVNGNTVINAGETGTTAGINLYVYLVDSITNVIVDSAKVLSDGTYTLDANPNTKYTIHLSSVQYPIGTNTNTTPIDTELPTGWVNTGENGTNNTGSGDLNPNGILSVSVGTTNVTQQNFGIKLNVDCPQNLSYTLIPCFSGAFNCEDADGIITCSGQFETIENGIIPIVYGTETYPSSFSTYMNSTNQGVIADTSIFSGVFYKTINPLQTPTKTLYTRTWFLVTTAGDTITCTQEIEFNRPASLPVTYTSVSGACAGANSIEITSPLGSQYEYSIDKGLTWQSSTIFNNVLPGRYDIILRADSVLYCGEASVVFNKYICGTVFNDVNGNTNIDGTESGFLPNATPVYIYLVDEFNLIVGVSVVASDGKYSFEKGLNESGTFTLHLSKNLYALGEETDASIIVQDLPGGWVNTGENGANNTGAGDLNPNGILTVVLDSTNRTNQNFGLAPIPIADDKTYIGLDPQTTRFLPTNNVTYPNAMPLNNVTGSAQGPVSLIDGTMPGNVTGTDYNAGYIGAAAGANNNMTFVTDGVVYDPNSPTTPLTNTVLAYNFEGQNFLLNPDPTAADPSYIFWNPTKGQYEIPQFNPNNLNVWFNVEGQTGFIFEYAWINQAGVQGENATYLVNATGPLAILPVELTSFEVEVVNSDVKLTWTTASEKNNDRFEIERSSDGINFVKVGTVQGNGTTSLPQAYNFTDINPGVGVHYYRLKQVDFDAQFEYSPIKSAEIVGTVSISIYPNPVQNILNIEVADTRLGEGKGMIVLYNAAGAEIIRESLVGSDRRQLDVSQIPSGTYLLRYQSEEMIKTFKVVISH